MDYLFQHIKSGNEPVVLELLKPFLRNTESNSNAFFNTPQLCHPLCNCSSCLSKISESTPNINSKDDKGQSAIFIAVINGLPKMVTLLLANGALVNLVDDANWSPLHYAAANGYQNILLLLLHAGAPINLINVDRNSALHLACSNGHLNCCKAILFFAEHMLIKININGQNKKGDTPLHIASRWGFQEMIETLLENGAKVDIVNKFGQNCYDVAHNLKIVGILSKSDKSNCGRYLTQTPGTNERHPNIASSVSNKLESFQRLSNAILKGDTGLVIYLLDLPTQDSRSNQDSTTCHPLCTCSICIRNKQTHLNRRTSQTEKLDINDSDVDGNTPLHIAANHGKLSLVKILLQYGADTKKQNKYQQTALHLACKSMNISIVKELVKASTVDIIDFQDISGETALMYAVTAGDLKLVETLLASEPNLQLKNKFGETALDIAKNKIHPSIVNALNVAKSKSSQDCTTQE